MRLDTTDRKIIDALHADARRSASEVGRIVGLSAPATKRRIQRLEQTGVIRAYTTVVDHRLLDARIEAFIELRFGPGSQVGDIDTSIIQLPEVLASFTLAGDPDALAHVRVRDLDHLKDVVDRIRRGRRGGPKIVATRTMIVLGRAESGGAPPPGPS
jgi:Lrp/AsnC family leucine-responsive transcriptional regulator